MKNANETPVTMLETHAWKANNWFVWINGEIQGVIELVHGQTITGYAWLAFGATGEERGLASTLTEAQLALEAGLRRVLSPAPLAALELLVSIAAENAAVDRKLAAGRDPYARGVHAAPGFVAPVAALGGGS